jgi:hypothetical protein
VSSRKIACGVAWALTGSALLLHAASAEEGSKPPKDYRKLVMEKQASLFAIPVERGTMDISDLRPADAYAGAEWMACLMTDTARKPRKWALYFRGEEIVHLREALAIDRCNAEVYTPLKTESKKAEKKPAR